MRSVELKLTLDGYYALRDERAITRFEMAQVDDFAFWSRITWCKIMFVYCNNEENRRLNRVGRISGFRIATRNLDLIPTQDRPNLRNVNSRTIRYYDVTRVGATRAANGTSAGGLGGKVLGNNAQPGQWRSFRRDQFSILVEVWSFERQKWGTKDEFTIRSTVVS